MIPIDPVADRRPPMSQNLALRVAVLGVVAFVLFGIVFFRLWYLQVLSGDQYLAQANDNRVRVERDAAPRGAIVDRSGQPLVDNRRANVVTIAPEQLPQEVRESAARYGQLAGRRERRPKGRKGEPIPIPALTDAETKGLYRRLGRVLDMSWKDIHERVVGELVQVPYAPVVLRTDVSNAARNFLAERRRHFQGVEAELRFLRAYPNEGLAAQVFGTVGEISPSQLKDDERFRGVPQGTIVGQDGLEYRYDRYLRGVDGSKRIIVDANGNPKGSRPGRDPVPGKQLQLTLDLGLQTTMQQALGRAGGGAGSAAVALDPTNGEVLAMASLPTYDPKILARAFTQDEYERRFGEEAGSPLFNRAIGAVYPTGSTFKPVTALAGLSAGKITPLTVIDDPGCIRIGRGIGGERCNAGKKANGPVALRKALTVSSDIYFYRLGQSLNPVRGRPLQTWARRMGYGRRAGIDLPGEVRGTVPGAEWRERRNQEERDCRKRRKVPSCFIVAEIRPWNEGDNVNLSTGQGDLQATPLQVALSYAAIANGGRVPRPHFGGRVEDDQGRLIQQIDPGTARTVKMDPAWQQGLMEGLKGAASGPGGTSTGVFSGWDHDRFPVYGKTGTAETGLGRRDQSWYVAYSFRASPEGKRLDPIVIAATIERGGFGAEAAAPAVRQMLSKWFTGKAGQFIVGESRDR